MKRKSIVVSRIIHIGKENNDLEKVQTFGLDSNSYVAYEDKEEIERKFSVSIDEDLLKWLDGQIKTKRFALDHIV